MLFTALITPFIDGKVDFKTLESLLIRQQEMGIKGVVLLGSTGEGTLVTNEERKEIYALGRRRFFGHLMCGCTDLCPSRISSYIEMAKEVDADSILLTLPPYVRLTQEEIQTFFEKILSSNDLPLMIYNNPSRGLTPISTKIANCLIDHPNVLGYKDSSGSIEYGKTINKKLYTGDDPLAFPLLDHSCGHVSVLSNLIPKQILRLMKKDEEVHQWVLQFFAIVGANPVVVKYAMSCLNLSKEECRAPYLALSKEQKEEVNRVLECLPPE